MNSKSIRALLHGKRSRRPRLKSHLGTLTLIAIMASMLTVAVGTEAASAETTDSVQTEAGETYTNCHYAPGRTAGDGICTNDDGFVRECYNAIVITPVSGDVILTCDDEPLGDKFLNIDTCQLQGTREDESVTCGLELTRQVVECEHLGQEIHSQEIYGECVDLDVVGISLPVPSESDDPAYFENRCESERSTQFIPNDDAQSGTYFYSDVAMCMDAEGLLHNCKRSGTNEENLGSYACGSPNILSENSLAQNNCASGNPDSSVDYRLSVFCDFGADRYKCFDSEALLGATRPYYDNCHLVDSNGFRMTDDEAALVYQHDIHADNVFTDPECGTVVGIDPGNTSLSEEDLTDLDERELAAVSNLAELLLEDSGVGTFALDAGRCAGIAGAVFGLGAAVTNFAIASTIQDNPIGRACVYTVGGLGTLGAFFSSFALYKNFQSDAARQSQANSVASALRVASATVDGLVTSTAAGLTGLTTGAATLRNDFVSYMTSANSAQDDQGARVADLESAVETLQENSAAQSEVINALRAALEAEQGTSAATRPLPDADCA